VTLIGLTWILASHFLSRAIHGVPTVGALAGLLLFQGWFLYVGYFSFLLGIPALLTAVAFVHRLGARWQKGADMRPELFGLAASGIVGYYCHLIIAAIFLVTMSAAMLFFLRHSRPVLIRIGAASLPTAILAASYLSQGSVGGGGMTWDSASATVRMFVTLPFWSGFFSPGLSFSLSRLLLGVSLLALLLEGTRWLTSREAARQGVLVLLMSGSLLLLYLAAPETLGASGNVLLRERVQLAFWASLLPALGSSFRGPIKQLVVGMVLVLAAWQATAFSMRIRRFNATYDDVVEQAKTMPPGSVARSVQSYALASFEGSFARVLGEFQADVAYHCRCVLVQAHAPSLPSYWVRARPGVSAVVDFDLDINRSPADATVLEPRPLRIQPTSVRVPIADPRMLPSSTPGP
jgi:hypothetical protein